MRPHRALCRTGLGAALWLALAGAPGVAVADDGSPPAVSSKPTLPETANRIGRIKRDANGRIVPAGPPLVAEPAPSNGPLAPYGGGGGGTAVPQLSSFDPQALRAVQRRTDHEIQAQKMQAEVDRIVRGIHLSAFCRRDFALRRDRGHRRSDCGQFLYGSAFEL